MAVTQPGDLHLRWIEGVNAGDLEGVAALYEPTSSFVVEPGRTVTGLEAVREALGGLFAIKARGTLDPRAVIEAGDLALLISRWELTGESEEGEAIPLAGQTADVVRRQADGTWLFAIDNPWGDAAVS